ncbi:MAG: hypothetical protein ACPGO3_16060 [Magnetospiraceae bacterium]
MQRQVLTALGAVFLLAGCAGAFPGNPQNHAGLTMAEVFWEDGALKSASIIDGKEKQDVALVVRLPEGGSVDYRAAGVSAFQGQAIRGAVEQAVAAHLADAAPGVVQAITETILRGIALQTGAGLAKGAAGVVVPVVSGGGGG